MFARTFVLGIALIAGGCSDVPPIQLPVIDRNPSPASNAEELRYSVSLEHDGATFVGTKRIARVGAARTDYLRSLRTSLAEVARSMKRVRVNPERGTGPLVPGEPLFVRADARVPFREVVDLIDSCRLEGIQLWSLRLFVNDRSRGPSYFNYELPRDVGISCWFYEHPQFEVIRLRDDGMLFWREIDGGPGPRVARTVELGELAELAGALRDFNTDAAWYFAAHEDVGWGLGLQMLVVFAESRHNFALPGELPAGVEPL